MFDEELDQLGGGRRNTFSEWSVIRAHNCHRGLFLTMAVSVSCCSGPDSAVGQMCVYVCMATNVDS